MSLVCLFPFTISFSLSLSLLNFTLLSTKNSPPHLFMLFKISFKALHGRSLYIGLAQQLYICILLLDGACGMPYEVYIFIHLHIVFNKIITTKKLQIYNPFELLHQCLILSYHKENIYQTWSKMHKKEIWNSKNLSKVSPKLKMKKNKIFYNIPLYIYIKKFIFVSIYTLKLPKYTLCTSKYKKYSFGKYFQHALFTATATSIQHYQSINWLIF